jgi:hypothetical protein
MGWFTYKCNTHGTFKASLPKREKTMPCKKCNEPSLFVPKVGTTVVYERLDNGAMSRAVERIHNVEELMGERNDKSRADTNEPDE